MNPSVNISEEVSVLILGELHGDSTQMKRIEEIIEQFKPDALVHELAYDDICLANDTLSSRIKESGVGKLCDPTLNKDVYEFALKLGVPLIGCDLAESEFAEIKGRGLATNFKVRETGMVNVIREASKRYKRIAVVVGATHLRTASVELLGGRSLILEAFLGDDKVKILQA